MILLMKIALLCIVGFFLFALLSSASEKTHSELSSIFAFIAVLCSITFFIIIIIAIIKL